MADEILVAEDGTIIQEQEPPKEDSPQTENQEDIAVKAESEDESHAEDEQAAEGESAEDAEARRERNRQRRAENKAHKKAYIDSLKREIAARDEILQQQASRLDALERRTNSADVALVDAELKKAVDAYNFFKQQHADAVTQANGQMASEANERMLSAMVRARELNNIRQAAQRPQQQQQPLDPRLKMQAETWLDRNNWYDPNGQDADSQIAMTVDRQMHQSGWDPTTPQYWDELDARLKKYLPHRYNVGYTKPQGNRAKAPVAGSGRESSNQSSGGYKLSADRVTALKEAGMWDDPKQRAEAIKRFQQFDKEQANG